ncbi:hypothetical protein LQ958_14720, partial [Ectothiorhodospira sp. A-7R]|uniref:hypothetical protein n=1 Tax=Ectothiorhodospira lacustris TaxID=2899127 RepID=UPI001EE919C1
MRPHIKGFQPALTAGARKDAAPVRFPCSLTSSRPDGLRVAEKIFEFHALRGMFGCVLVRKLFQVE